MPDASMTYRSAGVDIDEAQRALRSVVPNIASTYTPEVMAGVGGFGALFRAGFPGYDQPVLVSSIDGVGTKTKIAAMVGDFASLGRDIVNHCVNDILCQGAKPLFFLDYFGCSRLPGLAFEAIVAQMAAACREVGCALIGGETAEMPAVYVDDEIDLVGTIVGLVDAELRYPRQGLKAGDAVIGIASHGLHTNGYTLARKTLFEHASMSVRDLVPGQASTIGEELLLPHKCYFQSLYHLLMEGVGIHGVVHITGGGFYENIPRVLPGDLKVVIERRTWSVPPIFQLIQSAGSITDHEMYRTFNMGIGMVLLAEASQAAGIVHRLSLAGENAAIIGEIQAGAQDVQLV